MKSSFRSQDAYIFVLTFPPFGENGLFGKMMLFQILWRHSLVNNNYNTYIVQYLKK